MKSNKSIDGLSKRVPKKTSKISPSVKTSKKKQLVASQKTLVSLQGSAKPVASKTETVGISSRGLHNKAELKVSKTGAMDVRYTNRMAKQKTLVSAKADKNLDKAQDSFLEDNSDKQVLEDFLTPTKVLNLEASPAEPSKESTQKTDEKPKRKFLLRLKLKSKSKSKQEKTEENFKENLKEKSNKDIGKKLKQPKEKKKPSKLRRIITSILLIIVLALIGGAIWLAFWGNDIILKITGGKGSVFDLFTVINETYEPLKTDANGRTNILAFGTSGYNMAGDEGNGVHDGAQLTDSIMMISLNQETGDIVMSSLPRDLKASPTCTATGKINEVYWCHGGGGKATLEQESVAANALMTEVGGIFGVEFQYYAHINWGSLVQIVDTLGGITITLDEDILDYGWTGAVYKAGVEYTINGEEALGLARARHGTSGGDFSRGSSQQKILIGIKDKLLEKKLSIPELLSLASALGDNLRTNFSVNDFKTMAHLSTTLDLNSMRQISLYPDYMTTANINGISYVIPRAGVSNYGAIQSYISDKLSNDPRTYEESTILILNATDEVGLAAAEQELLAEEGYKNITIGDTNEAGFVDEYTLYYKGDGAPGTKNLLEEHYWFDALPIDELPESISRDYTFVIVLGPSASLSSPSQEDL
ncbi:MAG: LCP family protein [Candidatus Saccharibacteria bacterium]|nr:LCP family protein [Candidatus Saccharibacteria bacterium]